MKKFFSMLLVVSTLFTTHKADAQAANYSLANPSGSYTSGSFPRWYAKLDTLATGAGTDTLKLHVKRGYVTSYNNNLNSITFQETFTKISGTLGGTMTYYATCDSSQNWVAIGSAYTVTNSATQSTMYTINAGIGNPYADYMVVWNGTGTMSGSWQGIVLIR